VSHRPFVAPSLWGQRPWLFNFVRNCSDGEVADRTRFLTPRSPAGRRWLLGTPKNGRPRGGVIRRSRCRADRVFKRCLRGAVEKVSSALAYRNSTVPPGDRNQSCGLSLKVRSRRDWSRLEDKWSPARTKCGIRDRGEPPNLDRGICIIGRRR